MTRMHYTEKADVYSFGVIMWSVTGLSELGEMVESRV